jgi:hypothetical protein
MNDTLFEKTITDYVRGDLGLTAIQRGRADVRHHGSVVGVVWQGVVSERWYGQLASGSMVGVPNGYPTRRIALFELAYAHTGGTPA